MSTSAPANEPTADFNTRCLEIVQQWQSGDLPFADANQQLLTLEQEATANNQIVNEGRVEQLLGYMNSYRGSLKQAIYHYERARVLYNQAGNSRRVAICDLNMGETYRHKGDFKRARLLFEQACTAFHTVGDRANEAITIGNKGQMFLSLGSLEAARTDLEASYQLTMQLPPDTPNRSGSLCELHHALASLALRGGDCQRAWIEARQAYKLAATSQQPLELGFANRAIAEVLTASGSAPETSFVSDPDVYYQAASEAFTEINAEGEIARTMFAQAKSLARRGRRMTAARKLQLALNIFSRLGMVDDAAKAAEAQLEVL